MALSAISPTPFSLPSSRKSNPKLHRFVYSRAFKALNSNNSKPHLTSSQSLSNQQKLDSSFGFDIKHRGQILTLSELLEKSNVTPISVSGDLNTPITGIKKDSRKVTAGDVFLSCFGYKTNGHLYIKDAIRRGAVAVVVSEGTEVKDSFNSDAVIVVVKNTNAITPVLASTFFNNPSKSLKVIGITGTNGKTTTTYLVRSLLNAVSMKTGMLGSVGYYVDGGNEDLLEASNTTPDSVSVQELMANMVKKGTDAVVMEVSSIGLAVGRCNEIDFDIAVFMNLTRDHHDFHGNEEEYKKSKAKLFKKMTDKRRHRKVINSDDPNAAFFAAQGNPEVPVVSFAMEDKNADVHPLKIELNMFKTKVWVKTPNGVVKISSGLIGRYNVYNILACVAVGVAIGVPLEDIARGIENVDGVPGRFELIDEGQDFCVIVDYAHSPDSFSRLLDAGRELGAKRIITVFGCAGETDKGKRPMLVKIATEKSDVVVLTCGNPKTENQLHIFDDMLAGIGWNLRDYLQYSQNDQYLSHENGHRIFLHDNRRVAIRAAIAMGKKGDMIFFLARGHEAYQLDGDQKRYIDDRDECRDALRDLEMLYRAGMHKKFPMATIDKPTDVDQVISESTHSSERDAAHCEVIREPMVSIYIENEASHALA